MYFSQQNSTATHFFRNDILQQQPLCIIIIIKLKFLSLGRNLTCRGNIIKILQVVVMSRRDRVNRNYRWKRQFSVIPNNSDVSNRFAALRPPSVKNMHENRTKK